MDLRRGAPRAAPASPRTDCVAVKLSARLLLLVLIAALPVLALQVYEQVELRAQRKEVVGEQALQLAHLAAAQQDQFVEGARALLTALARLPEVQRRDPEACSALFAELKPQFPAVTGIGATAPDGISFCGSMGVPGDKLSLADRGYFQDALSRKALAISGYIVGRRTGEPSLNFTYPALDAATGEVRAVLVLAFNLDQLSASLAATPRPAGATMVLIDRDGTLLARTPPAPDWIGRRLPDAAFTDALLARREGTLEGVGIDGVGRLYGFAPLFASSDLFAVVGLPWHEAVAEADRLFRQEILLIGLIFLLAAVAALVSGEAWIRRPVGELQRVVGRMAGGDLSARAAVGGAGSPELRALAGSVNGMAGSLEARQAALKDSEERFRAVVETAADGIITIDEGGTIAFVNPAALRLFGYGRDELVGRNVSMLMPPPDRDRHDGYIARYLRTGEARIIGIGREVTGRRADGTTFPLFLSVGEFRLDGRRYFAGIVRDVTERRRAEEHQRLLMAELDHRAKNMLATVQSMVLLSRRNARSLDDYAEGLVGRIGAMARVHALLARERWAGTGLHNLIREEVEPFVGAGGAGGPGVVTGGDDVRLRPRTAQTLSLALHELATNAVKYGALSVPGGRVTVTTAVRRGAPAGEEDGGGGSLLRIDWTESGGPAVAGPPERPPGFGTTVIERSIAHELDGTVRLEFAETGLRCRIEAPLADVAAAGEDGAARAAK